MTIGRSVLAAIGAGLLLLASTSDVSATALLYHDPADGTTRWEAALSDLGFTPVGTDAAFITALSMNTYDVVVVQLDNDPNGRDAAVGTAIQAYIDNGGRVIYSNFQSHFDSSFKVQEAGVGTLDSGLDAFLDVGSELSFGLSSTSLLVTDFPSPLLGVFWRSFTSTDMVDAQGLATFDDGNLGIVVANDRKTIINGFMGLTLNEADEIQLYKNEIGYLVAVPEPATGALLGLGLVTAAALRYRRRT